MISPEIMRKIEEEVAKNVLLLKEDDPWTAEFVEEYDRNYKEAQCLLLNWLKNLFPTEKVLYAGSGFDKLPKFTLGEENVFHTSLEDYKTDEIEYFPELGDGIKVVANNIDLPFPQSSFDMVIFFGLFTETSKEQLIESRRVLNEGGLFVCDNDISGNIDLEEIFPDYIKIEIPSNFQNRGISETSFCVLKKQPLF